MIIRYTSINPRYTRTWEITWLICIERHKEQNGTLLKWFFCISVMNLYFAACQTPLGMQSGAIKNSSLSASTFKDNLHKAVNARPSQSVGWCSKVIFVLVRFLSSCKQVKFCRSDTFMIYWGSEVELVNFLCQICWVIFWFCKVNWPVDRRTVWFVVLPRLLISNPGCRYHFPTWREKLPK